MTVIGAPSAAMHMALLGAVVVLALVVFGVYRVNRRRDERAAADAERREREREEG